MKSYSCRKDKTSEQFTQSKNKIKGANTKLQDGANIIPKRKTWNLGIQYFGEGFVSIIVVGSVELKNLIKGYIYW